MNHPESNVNSAIQTLLMGMDNKKLFAILPTER